MSPTTSSLTAARIKAQAREIGFDGCGIAPAAELPELRYFAEWIARGYHGTMTWLADSAVERSDIRRLLPQARSVVVTATNYNAARAFSTECADPTTAQVARYAWGDDYHDVVNRRQRALLSWMRTQSDQPFYALDYVDTGPVQERVFAQHAGIGWIGKNCCVINESIGSFIFLGIIATSLDLELDAPSLDQCGTCTLCLDACPTRALVAPGVLDARRCISYLTIEHRGDVAPELASGVGSRVYGCDVCQEVCPWNAMAPASSDPAWRPRPIWDRPPLAALEQLSDDELRQSLKGSAMRRAKVEGLRRNIRLARENAQRL